MLPQRPSPLLVKEEGRANTKALHCREGKEGSQWSEWEENQGKSAAWDTGETEESEDVNTDEVLVKRRGGGKAQPCSRSPQLAKKQIPAKRALHGDKEQEPGKSSPKNT